MILASQILYINNDIDFMFAVCVKDLHVGVCYCLDLCTLGGNYDGRILKVNDKPLCNYIT